MIYNITHLQAYFTSKYTDVVVTLSLLSNSQMTRTHFNILQSIMTIGK